MSVDNVSGSATYANGKNIYINSGEGKSGSFEITADTSDDQSGIRDVLFPLVSGLFAGFSGFASPISSAPYTQAYSWSGVVSPSPTNTVTATNNIGSVSTDSFALVIDNFGPTGGSLLVNNGLSLVSTTGTYPLSRVSYNSDSGSGLWASQLLREDGTLSSENNQPTCSFSGAPQTSLTGDISQVDLPSGCYRYTLIGTDNVGNVSQISQTMKVDRSPPSNPTLTVDNLVGDVYQAGGKIYVNAQNGFAGSFDVSADTADPQSGLASVAFGPLFPSQGITLTSAPYKTTYSWSGSATLGSSRIRASNNFGLWSESQLTVFKDISAPYNGQVTINGNADAGERVVTDPAGVIDRVDYLDNDFDSSGILFNHLRREVAPIDGGGACGAYVQTNEDYASSFDTYSPGFCYRYTLLASDNVSNLSSTAPIIIVFPVV